MKNSRIKSGFVSKCILVLASLWLVAVCLAQTPSRPEGPGLLHFSTKLGSFKILNDGTTKVGKDKKVVGTLSMTFTGSAVFSGLTQPLKITGKFIKEYESKSLGKVGYHGSGTIVCSGSFTSAEFFGINLTATFDGRALLRLYGEFDKDLNTGIFYYTDPKVVQYWQPNTATSVYVPDYTHPGSGTAAPGQIPVSRGQFDKKKGKGG